MLKMTSLKYKQKQTKGFNNIYEVFVLALIIVLSI